VTATDPSAPCRKPEDDEGEPPPWFTRDAIYGVVQDTASGIERVVKLAIRRTRG
jgi:hypothetical protein